MGGPLAASDTVVAALAAQGISVLRIAGSDGPQTAVELARCELGPAALHSGLGSAGTGGVTIARGAFFSDGLAGAIVAADGPSAQSPEPPLLTASPTTMGSPLAAFRRARPSARPGALDVRREAPQTGGADEEAEMTETSSTQREPAVSFNDMGQSIHQYGSNAVDFEQRVTFVRLRAYRLERAREALRRSELGALLCFDVNNVRYITSTAIGEWSRDKYVRYTLLTRDGEPYVWDFGSAAVHHRLYAPWIDPERSIGAFATLRGAVAPGAGITEKLVAEVKDLLAEAGVADAPLGVDTADAATFLALQAAGLDVRDGQQVMLDAREIKSTDEILLLSHAAAMVDGAYQEVAEALKPGVQENEIVALVNEYLYRHGSDDVESVNAVSGERCIPHPHNFSDRIIRPGDLAFFDVMQAFNGYRTCYYRCFAVGRATQAQEDAYRRAREWIDAAIELVKPGVSTDEIARCWPTAEEIGLAGEREAFGLEFGHGLGLALHERPIISRLNSLASPSEIKEGMVFALETYCPATDGYSGARIEEEVVVTKDGPRVITRFPSQTLFVTHEY